MRAASFRIFSLALILAGFLSSSLPLHARADDQQDRTQPSQKEKPKTPAQQKGEESADETEFRLRADLVVLDVTVVDSNNRPVMDLRQDQFQILEDKVPQQITSFSRDSVPVSMVLTIDTSGSMRPKLDTVIKASSSLAREGKKGDEIAVIQFKDEPELLEEFTPNIEDVVDTLKGLVASSQTHMLDALYLAADYGHKEGRNRRKAVVVVTDGLDKDSVYSFNEVVGHLRETDVQVYLIGFTNELEQDKSLFRKSEKQKAEALLTKLADETGGKAFFPKDLAEVHTIAQQISNDLRAQYSIGYYSSNSKKDGTFRAIRVQVNGGERRLVARTRAGYTAPRAGDQPAVQNNK
jgi:Ca-activated chloride channel family protein